MPGNDVVFDLTFDFVKVTLSCLKFCPDYFFHTGG